MNEVLSFALLFEERGHGVFDGKREEDVLEAGVELGGAVAQGEVFFKKLGLDVSGNKVCLPRTDEKLEAAPSRLAEDALELGVGGAVYGGYDLARLPFIRERRTKPFRPLKQDIKKEGKVREPGKGRTAWRSFSASSISLWT